MDAERANEIMHSPEAVKVTCNNRPVWLENIKSKDIIEISYLEDQVREEVPLGMLTEEEI